jgi:pimeloyl-ACP methyl ester carboxylesterase
MSEAAPTYPGAVGPARSRDFDANGFRLRLHEWGDPAGEPVVLCHGMWDHSRGFDLFAPWLAERFRVVAIDARGHGDSEWADSYMHHQDVVDIVRVLRSFGRPVRLVGHSKGGGQATGAAVVAPECVSKLVNIEGFGPPKGAFNLPGRPAREPDSPEAFTEFLDGRRRLAQRPSFRPYPALDDLVERRKLTNPRLSTEWLRYFAWHGAHRSEEGFRWKVDPLAGSGAGPFRPDWIGPSWRALRAPMLAMTGREPDTWGLSDADTIAERLAFVPHVERVDIASAGHFPHMEQPAHTARVVLDFLTS